MTPFSPEERRAAAEACIKRFTLGTWREIDIIGGGEDAIELQCALTRSQAELAEAREDLAKVYEGRLINAANMAVVTVELPHSVWRKAQEAWYTIRRNAQPKPEVEG